MQYNNIKKAELVTMINDKDTKIAELEAALKIANYTIGRYEDLMKNLIATSKGAIANAEKSQKVAEDSQKIAADAINVAKKVTGKKLAAPKPDTTEKKPMTREEALTAKYGSKEQRQQYILDKRTREQQDRKTKAQIYDRARTETTAECKATGNWVPKAQWTKIYNEKVDKYFAEAGLTR